jgi:von Willebrand factor type A domain
MFHLFVRFASSGMSDLKMKSIPSLAALAAVAMLWQGAPRLVAAEEEGVAIAIVYDTSGSMREPVRNSEGGLSPKYVIANRALITIAKQIQTFATNSATGAPRRIQTALFTFDLQNAKEVIKMGPFDAAALQNWARNFAAPSGNTPLGNALNAAGQAVLASPLSRKHVLVITDGINTAGPQPAAVLPKLKQQAEQNHAGLSVHFVAFDVDAKVFDPVKKLGATVVGAADEKQLNTQLDFILQRKILLEEEEPKK